jgi:hypothetical protein
MPNEEFAPAPSWDLGSITIFPPPRSIAPPTAASPPSNTRARPGVGQIDDPLEHEAALVADQIMRAPASKTFLSASPPSIAREHAAYAKRTSPLTKPDGFPHPATGETPDIVHQVLRSPGLPLDQRTRGWSEARFGCDFSKVRIHTDASAAISADAIAARAFTAGSHIVFARGRYCPDAAEGRKLLAHELTHVVQQSDGAVPVIRREPDRPSHSPSGGPDSALLRDLGAAYKNGWTYRSMPDLLFFKFDSSIYGYTSDNFVHIDEVDDKTISIFVNNGKPVLVHLHEATFEVPQNLLSLEPDDDVSSAGTRWNVKGPRQFYRNPHALDLAMAGNTKEAEIWEAGHGCSGCHVEFLTNGPVPDSQLDLNQYNRVAIFTKLGSDVVGAGYDPRDPLTLVRMGLHHSGAHAPGTEPAPAPSGPTTNPMERASGGRQRGTMVEGSTEHRPSNPVVETKRPGSEPLPNPAASATPLPTRPATRPMNRLPGGAKRGTMVSGSRPSPLPQPVVQINRPGSEPLPNPAASATPETLPPVPGSQNAARVPRSPSNPPRPGSAEANAIEAQRGGLVNPDAGRVGVQTHATSPATRRAIGVSGDTHQSAHLVPQAVYRALGVSPGRALTVNLPIDVHAAIDAGWVPLWNKAVSEGTPITRSLVQKWVGEAIDNVPAKMLTTGEKGTLQWRLDGELHELGLTKPDSVIVPGTR